MSELAPVTERRDGTRSSVHIDGRVTLWGALFGALSLAAGLGVYLIFFALRQETFLEKSYEFGGVAMLCVMAWFVVALPLALGVYVARARLLVATPGKLKGAALLAWIVTTTAFVGLIVLLETYDKY